MNLESVTMSTSWAPLLGRESGASFAMLMSLSCLRGSTREFPLRGLTRESPPWQESFGIAFAEAAAFGVPAVGSKSGGIPDAVVDGETGILVPEESDVDLADALTLLYQKPEIRKQMGMAARERARRQFSPRVIAARFLEKKSQRVKSQQGHGSDEPTVSFSHDGARNVDRYLGRRSKAFSDRRSETTSSSLSTSVRLTTQNRLFPTMLLPTTNQIP